MIEARLFTLGEPCPWCGGKVANAPGIGLYCENGLKCTMPMPWECRYVREHTPEELIPELITALEVALQDLHILDSRLQDKTEAAGNKYYGLRSVRLVEAALEKADKRRDRNE